MCHSLHGSKIHIIGQFCCEGLQPKHGGVPLRKEDDWPVPQEINSNAEDTGSGFLCIPNSLQGGRIPQCRLCLPA